MTILSLTDGPARSQRMVDIAYECTLCGQGDVSCKVVLRHAPLSAARELRHWLNRQGHIPAAYPGVSPSCATTATWPAHRRAPGPTGPTPRPQDVQPGRRPRRARGLLFHAGCRYSFDPTLRGALHAAVKVLTRGGVDSSSTLPRAVAAEKPTTWLPRRFLLWLRPISRNGLRPASRPSSPRAPLFLDLQAPLPPRGEARLRHRGAARRPGGRPAAERRQAAPHYFGAL